MQCNTIQCDVLFLVRQKSQQHVSYVVATESSTGEEGRLVGLGCQLAHGSCLRIEITTTVAVVVVAVEPQYHRGFPLKHPHHPHRIHLGSHVADQKPRAPFSFQYSILVVAEQFSDRFRVSRVHQYRRLVPLRALLQGFVGLAAALAPAPVLLGKDRARRASELQGIEAGTLTVFDEGQCRCCRFRRFAFHICEYRRHLVPWDYRRSLVVRCGTRHSEKQQYSQ
mmetsp:Transcript_2133/g.4618  ORF Transcript_2133/g.4618 Transcript_2133/m.4618 type:complete len:224 (+) Transcript_2133:427-1098(+)